jgi:hypothetical protein
MKGEFGFLPELINFIGKPPPPMTAASFFESVHGIHAHSLPKTAILDLMEKFSDHKYEEFKKRKETFNSERFLSEQSFEEQRKRLKPGNDGVY